MKSIKLNKNKSGELYLDLKHFEKYVDDIEKVKYYKLEVIDDLDNGKCLLLSLYDKNKKLIEVKELKWNVVKLLN